MTSTSLGEGIKIGSYQIDTVLGIGSDARVLGARARDDERVVLKVFAWRGADAETGARARRDREADALRRARGAGFASLIDIGEDPDHGAYFVTHYVDGRSLRAIAAEGAMLPEHAVACLSPVVEAVASMHARGLVHGDLKPEHVMLTPAGGIVVLDLGLAFDVGAAVTRVDGTVSGTLGYVAPELFERLPASTSIDVFALGVMLYELIAGDRPFVQTSSGHVASAPRALDELDGRVSRAFATLVERCLSTSPQERPTANALGAELSAAILAAPKSHAGIRSAIVRARDASRAESVREAVETLLDEADRCITEGNGFEATRLLDRALAYAPDDARIPNALERAMRAAPRPSRRRVHIALFTVALVGCVIATMKYVRRPDSSPAPARVSAVAPARGVEPTAFAPLVQGRLPNATFVQGDPRQRAQLLALDARVRTHPEDHGARLRRARLRLTLGRYRDAHTDLLRLLEHDPDDVNTLTTLVALYDRVGEFPRAAPLLERIVVQRPRDADALTDLSIAYGDTPRGEQAIARAYAVAPRARRVLARRCSLAVHTRDARAIARCEEAHERARSNAFVLGDLAEAHLIAGDAVTARARLERALGLRPDDVGFLFRHAKLTRELGDDAAAARSLARACALADDPRCGPTDGAQRVGP